MNAIFPKNSVLTAIENALPKLEKKLKEKMVKLADFPPETLRCTMSEFDEFERAMLCNEVERLNNSVIHLRILKRMVTHILSQEVVIDDKDYRLLWPEETA